TVNERFRRVLLVTCSGLAASHCSIRKSGNDLGVWLVRVGLEPFQLRVAVATTLASEEPSIEREHECVARACERHVKESFHFLALDFFHLLFEIGAITAVECDERLLAWNDERVADVPTKLRLAREERHDDRVPLRSLRLMRSDKLYRIGFRRFSLAGLVEVAPKSQRQIGQELLPRFLR